MRMGKRVRNLMKRTTSHKELFTDLSSVTFPLQIQQQIPAEELNNRLKRRCSSIPSPLESAPFLMACGLCKRCLGPGFDTFMYRGEVAFCSNECREKQITIDEKNTRKKCSSSIVKKADHPPPPKRSESSASSETIAAA